MPDHGLNEAPASGAALAAALARFSLETLGRMVPRPAIEAALAHPLTYRGALAFRGTALRAELATPRARSRGREHLVQVRFYEGAVDTACSACPHAYDMCAHALGLLADLAVFPELREALGRGQEASGLLGGLPAARAAALAHVRAIEKVAAWALPAPEQAVREARVGVTVIDGRARRADGVVIDAAPAHPSLQLRVHTAGRALLDRDDLLGASIPGDLRRVATIATSLPGGRKGLAASGLYASLTLELLRNRPLVLEGTERLVRFPAELARLVITRRAVPRVIAEPPLPPLPAASSSAWWRRRPGKPERDARFESADPTPTDALEGRWVTGDGALDVSASEAALFSGPYPFVWVPAEGAFYPVDPAIDLELAWRVHVSPAIAIRGSDGVELYRALRAALPGRRVPLPSREAMGLPAIERPALRLRLDGQPLALRARLEAEYAAGIFELGGADAGGAAPEARDEDLERAAVARVLAAGFVKDPGGPGFQVDDDAAVAFWTTGLPALRGGEGPTLEILAPAALARVRAAGTLRPRVSVGTTGGWLDASVSFDADEASAEMAAVREALREKRRWVVLGDGSIADLSGAARELAEEVADEVDDAGAARLAPHQLGLVERWVEATPDAQVSAELARLRERWRGLSVGQARLPKRLTATLRPYQVEGLAWLQFLTELGAGGVLADDMGLGKTLMLLAHLAARKEREGAAPSLVVCPTSVAGNWAREAARFTPGLRVLVLTGPARAARFAEIPAHDLVITTYAILRRDVDALEQVELRAAVLDEAQNIKNAGAATTHAARRLRAGQRLALSGTPVENRLAELWSILDFVNPGMLGSARSFEARFERPIVADARCRAAAELRARIRPFVLRRTKKQVLADLPTKQEIERWCVPGAAQRRLYDVLAAVLRDELGKKIHAQGLARSGLAVLTALLRLRQMCLDPRLVDKKRRAAPSAKREAFLELVRALVAEGRRALVFSQFVELLTLWRRDLDREEIPYEYLDGSTQDRDAVVARFQEGTAPLFLISLKAGGAGLNLTAADTVIHCDPWWNPAVEDQATDRAHRIGQRRAVTVYRLVLKGSIEEKIAELKAKKRALAEAVVSDDAGALRGLSEDDVRSLLADVLPDDGGDDDDEPPPASAPPASGPVAPVPVPVTAPPPSPREPVEGWPLTQLVGATRAFLARTGATQSELARRVGVSGTQVSRLLNGRLTSISADLAARLRDVVTS